MTVHYLCTFVPSLEPLSISLHYSDTFAAWGLIILSELAEVQVVSPIDNVIVFSERNILDILRCLTIVEGTILVGEVY
jgi:hypothetical protein